MNVNTKVVFVGASFAGKTSLLNQFMRGQFSSNLPPSTQPACYRKTIMVDKVAVNLEMWDTAGQERYHSLSPLFYRDSQIGIIVFDMTSADSFRAAKDWAQELIGARGNEISLIVAANKLDLSNERAVSLNEAHDFAASIKGTAIEVSAKTGENVNLMFNTVAEIVVQKAKFLEKGSEKPDSGKKSGCSC